MKSGIASYDAGFHEALQIRAFYLQRMAFNDNKGVIELYSSDEEEFEEIEEFRGKRAIKEAFKAKVKPKIPKPFTFETSESEEDVVPDSDEGAFKFTTL